MRRLLISLLVSGVLSACTTAETPSTDYTLYLVRHAEKQAGDHMSDDNQDPALTAAGITRANKLAAFLQDKQIRDIWSSDYQRTRDTAAPLAAELDLEVKIYDPRDLPSLSADLQTRQRNAYVVGHSNTTPELASLLCQCAVDEMDDTEYDRLLIVNFQNGSATVETLTQ